jgi:uncharacterized membrane protein YidH (DUF202 family)
VQKLPHWWDDAAVVSEPAAAKADAAMDDGTETLLLSRAPSRGALLGPRAMSQCSIGIAENGSEDDLAALRRQPPPPKRTGQLARSMSAPTPSTAAPALETVVMMSPLVAVASTAERAAVPSSSRNATVECWPALRAACGVGVGGGVGGLPPKSDVPLVTAAAKRHVPIKIEPKTFFANERTMLQWLNMATLILFTSLALISYNDPLARNKVLENGKLDYSSQIAGAVLAPVAVVFIVYARALVAHCAVALARADVFFCIAMRRSLDVPVARAPHRAPRAERTVRTRQLPVAHSCDDMT